MTFRRSTAGLAGAVVVAAFTLSGLSLAGPASATGVAAGGGFADSYGLSIDTTILAGSLPVKVNPLGHASSSCPPTKAAMQAQVLGGGDAAVAKVAVLTSGAGASCTGVSPTSMAQSQVLNVDALGLAAQVALHADAITAISNSSCTGVPGGSVKVVNLTIGGSKVVPDGLVAPNTKVASPVLSLLGLTVILNEQHPTANGRGFVVNGVHIIAAKQGAAIPVGGTVLRGDVVISHALSGVVCPGGQGSTAPAPGAPGAPDLVFAKTVSQDTAKAGDVLTYTATVTNNSATACEVLRFVDHVAPIFTLVSTAGPFGKTLDTPAPVRGDGGPDAVIRPDALVIGAKKSVVQTFTVKVNAAAPAGTYYDTLELFCGPNGNFASGPLAPVTIGAPVVPVVPGTPQVIVPPEKALPRTGGSPLLALGAVAVLGAGLVVRKVGRR